MGNDELHSEFCTGDHIPKTADHFVCKETNGSMILNLNSNQNDKVMALEVGEPILETSLISGGPLKSPLGGIMSPVKDVGNNGEGAIGPLRKSKSLNKTRLPDLNFADDILMKPSRRIFSFNSRPRRKRRSKRCSHKPNISSNDEESSSSGETGSEASIWLGETADPIPQSVQPDGGLEDGATDEDNDFEPPVIDELLIENETQKTINLGELLGVNLREHEDLVRSVVRGEREAMQHQ